MGGATSTEVLQPQGSSFVAIKFTCVDSGSGRRQDPILLPSLIDPHQPSIQVGRYYTHASSRARLGR